MSTVAQASLDVGASDDEVQAVQAAFDRAGIDVEVEAGVVRLSSGELPWVMYVTLTVPIGAFLAAFASEAGKDAYAAFKEWAQSVFEARGDRAGSIVLRDPDYNRFVIPTVWPEEAFQKLQEIDWSKEHASDLYWESGRGEWRRHPSQ